MGVFRKNTREGGSRYEKIWPVLSNSSTDHPYLQVINIDAHCSHIGSPRDIADGILQRDSVNAPPEFSWGKVEYLH